MTAVEFRREIDQKGKIEACKLINPSISDESSADGFISSYIFSLLQAGNRIGAAILLWGETIFDPRPNEVRKVWNSINEHAKTLIQGSSGLGKSFTSIAWILLDYWEDPEFTNFKLISTTKGHSKANTYSTLVFLAKNTIVKMPGEPTADYFGLDPKERQSGVSIVAIPEGDDGKGRLQGFHPIPRPKPHPKFGAVSRVRAFMDECEEVPRGVWEGIDNMLGSMSGTETIKVWGAYNPKDQSTKTAMNAEPQGGWDMFDVEKGVKGKDEWVSKNGWFVLRLDAAKSENIKQRKVLYPGFQTYEGYRELQNKAGGNTPEFFSFGRGSYPPHGVVNIIISSSLITNCRGEFSFIDKPIKAGGGDVAFEGRDSAILAVGLFGKAMGFTPENGHYQKFKTPRMCLQLDQLLEMPKGESKAVGDSFKRNCQAIGISPEYLCLDRTGLCARVHDYLMDVWSAEVQGVDFNKPATEIKILLEDKYTPLEAYEGVVSEVWFALQKWMEYGYFAISPSVRSERLEQELRGRRYILGAGKKLRVEKKDDFKSRLGRSPDEADGVTLLLHGVRMRAGLVGSMTGKAANEEYQFKPQQSRLNSVGWVQDVW